MPQTSNFMYPGQELHLFAEASQWRAYWAARIRDYLGKDVLEVGAGIGTNTRYLCNGRHRRWVCLEPDAQLAARIRFTLRDSPRCLFWTVITGTLQDLQPDEFFDSILFIDVLEHIQNDRDELLLASSHLKSNGVLIVLSPALPWLFSKFDQAVGHYRRYTRKMLNDIAPPHLELVRMEYLDSLGILASMGNRFLLRRRNPTRSQIRLWDSTMVRCSRILHPLFLNRFGKSILSVWRNTR